MTSNSTPQVDISDYCEIGDGEVQSANIHGVPNNLSPVKLGKKTSPFDGEMRDGFCMICFVGFKAEQWKRLLPFIKNMNQWNYKMAR